MLIHAMMYSHHVALKEEIKFLKNRATEVNGSPIDMNSHANIRQVIKIGVYNAGNVLYMPGHFQVLFNRLKLDKLLPKSSKYKTSKGGHISTSRPVLMQLTSNHPLPQIILDYRQVSWPLFSQAEVWHVLIHPYTPSLGIQAIQYIHNWSEAVYNYRYD